MKTEKYGTREEWLSARRQGFGGSEVATLLGLFSRWSSPIQIYEEKANGRSFDVDDESKYWGRKHESNVIDRWQEEHPAAAVTRFDLTIVRNDKYPHLFCSPDAGARLNGKRIVIEAKSSRFGDDYGPDGTDEVPLYVMFQVQSQLMILECEYAEVPVLIGGFEYRCYRIAPNPEIQRAIEETSREFWENHIETKVPPPLEGLASEKDFFKKKYPNDETEPVEATAEDQALFDEYKKLVGDEKNSAKTGGSRILQVEGMLKERIGNAAGMRFKDGEISWKSAHRETVDWKALAESLSPTPEQIAAYRRSGNGGRRFLLKNGKRGG